jgi:membrane protein implicated in regulation of membrane protease activity
MDDWQVWFVAAVLLLIAEMFTPGFWLACAAIGCLAAGVVGLIPFTGLALQTITFAVTSVLSMVGLRPVLARHFLLTGSRSLRTGVDALLGKTGVVTERIEPGRTGRLVVEGEDWRGVSLDATVIEPGARVTVIQVDGTTLVVEKET